MMPQVLNGFPGRSGERSWGSRFLDGQVWLVKLTDLPGATMLESVRAALLRDAKRLGVKARTRMQEHGVVVQALTGRQMPPVEPRTDLEVSQNPVPAVFQDSGDGEYRSAYQGPPSDESVRRTLAHVETLAISRQAPTQVVYPAQVSEVVKGTPGPIVDARDLPPVKDDPVVIREEDEFPRRDRYGREIASPFTLVPAPVTSVAPAKPALSLPDLLKLGILKPASALVKKDDGPF